LEFYMAIVATRVAEVQELYVAYFGRPADPAGLDYWTNIVEAQGSTAAVSATFAASPEYIVTYFGKTNTEIVDQIYTNMFGRTADAAGRAYWVNLLNNGTIKVDTIVAEVAAAAVGTDSEAVENKVAAATAFTTELDTPAEVAGYAGTAALNQAKAFITGVTTDATLTAAINPATLEATVAAVVKAGTPFSLESAIAASTAAADALDEFLEDNDLDDLATPAAVVAALETAVTDAAGSTGTEPGVQDFTFTAGDISVALTGFAAAREGVQAAMLADAEADLNTALATATTDLATARAAATAGVRAIADNLAAADVALAEATKAAAEAVLVQNAAEAAVEARAGGRAVTITYNTGAPVDDDGDPATPPVASPTTDVDTVTIAGVNGGAAVTLIQENGSGNLVLASSAITETAYPGVTALLEALRANQDAQLDLQAATTARADAFAEFDGLTGASEIAANAIVTNTTAVEDAETAIEDLAELVTAWEEAIALQTEYQTLVAAQETADAAFAANGYVAPVALSGTLAATSGSDLFVLGAASVDAATVSSFGRSGNDAIFLGSEFTLNTGDLEAGNDSVMEVFFVQNGTRAEVHVEKAAYGSDSGDVTVITLVGVDAEDLVFTNGVITVGTGA
jgi:hypothetical protein